MNIFTQPKVAVLDAVIPDTMDSSVIVPVTDKIVEELVASGIYTVLDRINIEQVLQEKEFQLSGLVKDTEIKKAGEYLGANLVVVARVSRIENTFFISAKMIDVKTGAITAQTSDQQEGSEAILIGIAQNVGRKLAGGVIEETQEPVKVARREIQPPAQEQEKPAPPPAEITREEAMAGFKLVASYSLPVFSGDVYTGMEDKMEEASGGSYSTSGYGLDLYWSTLFDGFYISASFGHTVLAYKDAANDYTVFSIDDLPFGGGLGYTFGKVLRLYSGAKIGVISLWLEDFWKWQGDGGDELTICLGLEAGADLFLFKHLVLSARVQYTNTSFKEDTGEIFEATWTPAATTYDEPYPLNYLNTMIGIGFAY
ncbi:hypothetical protein ES707_12686 [subsurface metagenome]